MIKLKFYLLIVCLFTLSSNCSIANNISVSNFRLTGQNKTEHFTMVKFDISWENSFRESTGPANWDAAWVFVKYRQGTGAWQHAWLNNTGHINPSGSEITTGLLNPSLPFNQTTNPGMGAFIYRDANGSGTFSKSGVQLRWNYGANGLSDTAKIDIKVFAIEMVYVPQGSFFVGSGGLEVGSFYKYPSITTPYQIINENAINVGTTNDYLYYRPGGGDELGPIPATFPKGYNAFYCMKYEITQQGYTDFLNNLTASEASARYPTASPAYRFRITVTGGVYSTIYPFLACNWLSWFDVAAYLDWSGLRPMTELEYEKSCRGSVAPVPYEYAWGTANTVIDPYTLSNIGGIDENIATNYSVVVGNAAFGPTTVSIINGPVRVGIFAGNSLNTGRVTSGATYYGIMEMSGNVLEGTITVGLPNGRAFNGSHGNGLLSGGFADAPTWPGPPEANGSGTRGGTWFDGVVGISDRSSSTYGWHFRYHNYGGRGIRTAP